MSLNHENSNDCKKCPSLAKGIFCSSDEHSLAEISQHKIMNLYKKGQFLFTQGNQPQGIFFVRTGNIKITQTGDEGKETFIRIVSGGGILGHRSLFTNQTLKASATAMEDSSVCFLDKKFILKTIQKNPFVAMTIIEKLSKDMGIAEQKVISFHQKSVKERLAELLLTLKEGHGERQQNNFIAITLKITREEMATMIGTASETLIRTFADLKFEGIVDQDKKTIIIKNEKKLLDLANLPY